MNFTGAASLSISAMAFILVLSARSVEAPQQTPASSGATAAGTGIFHAKLLDADATPEVTTAELHNALQDVSLVLLDARPYEEFAKSHIPGARSVPGLPGLSPALWAE